MKTNLAPKDALTQIEIALAGVEKQIDKAQEFIDARKEDYIRKNQETAWFGKSRERWETRWHNGTADSIIPPVYYAEIDSRINLWQKRKRYLQTLEVVTLKAISLGVENMTLDQTELLYLTDF